MRKSKSRDVVRARRTSKVACPQARRQLGGAKLQIHKIPACFGQGNGV